MPGAGYRPRRTHLSRMVMTPTASVLVKLQCPAPYGASVYFAGGAVKICLSRVLWWCAATRLANTVSFGEITRGSSMVCMVTVGTARAPVGLPNVAALARAAGSALTRVAEDSLASSVGS